MANQRYKFYDNIKILVYEEELLGLFGRLIWPPFFFWRFADRASQYNLSN